ncbi:hypothetical protein IDH50_03195 [Aeromicrobium tamlense]|uniref:Uncharacterized protein n=1 Tax=Aeromicrobium tamlense TaxID=375541 RepID=A0A8I0FUY1_9ACTN|nr:abortive infection system antitoxin AbiGi family protein [Aeromicrobium tamlense]MBD1269230.1 hypothetical protein [Aeromicrobium tamlense]NYI36862.1 hypothetical protein [Aeromicrobium tamlense]
MVKIQDLLHRRTDLSTFLVHLSRDGGPGHSARENLISILAAGQITAGNPLGPARELEPVLEGTGVTQRVVCLTETPLEHVWMMLEQIEGRQVQFAPYGLATTKVAARVAGANPVWYTDMTKYGRTWPLSYMNDLVEQACARATVDGELRPTLLANEPFLRIAPYFETMGPTNGPGLNKEFWWEREWRMVGDYHLGNPKRWMALLAPEADHESLRADIAEIDADPGWAKRPILDPYWGLERMLAELAEVNPDYIGPFTSR